MLGSPAGPGGASQRGLWPIAPAPAPATSGFTTDGFGRYGIYSVFPGGPNLSGALYSHASAIGRFASGIQPSSGIPPSTGIPFHAAHKESLFASSGYTFGTATPPLSPYSPVIATQLEFLTKGFNSNIIIQPDFSTSPKKCVDKRCEDKCYQVKSECSCNCQASLSFGKKFGEVTNGCSRTNPIEWNSINVKKEPLGNPCQVSEITTSGSPVVKIEVTSPIQKVPELSISTMPSVVTSNGNIPVGIAVARQRVQHNEILSSPSLPPTGLLTTVNAMTHLKEFSRLTDDTTAGMAANTTAGVTAGGALLHCTDDRSAGLAAGWSVGGSHGSIATPTLWQYPAALPIEPMVPLHVPVPPVGVQLVRDPTSGQLLLLPTTGIEQIQQAVVWPNYQQHPSVLFPPLAPPPLQLLTSTSSDYLSANATLHHHTQTQSTRLLAVATTDSKRKMPLPLPTATLIKIEPDATSLDQTKALQTVNSIGTTGGMLTEPLLTTHVIYQHPTNLILPSAHAETSSLSQATSPVGCLMPQHETATVVEDDTPGVQDASNQTDTLICSEDDTTMHIELIDKHENFEENTLKINTDNTVSSSVDEQFAHSEPIPVTKPDLSGLELLSNSIVAFENSYNNESKNEEIVDYSSKGRATPMTIIQPVSKVEPLSVNNVEDKLIGLDLLCALAEQRIKEEDDVDIKAPTNSKETRESRRQKRKAKKLLREHESKKLKIDNLFKSPDHKTYKSRESEEEAHKYLASMSMYEECKYSKMDTNEISMRRKMAKLQKKYKATQRQLHKLKPKGESSEKCKLHKRIRTERDVTPPSLLNKIDVATSPIKIIEAVKPPVLFPVSKEVEDTIPKVVIPKHVKEYSQSPDFESENSDPLLNKVKSSKKRKSSKSKRSPNFNEPGATETIVARKPKSGFVGYLLAAKEKLQQNAISGSDSPPRYIDDSIKKKTKRRKSKKTINNNNIINDKKHKKKLSKIRPKLKAEVTMKQYEEDDEDEPKPTKTIVLKESVPVIVEEPQIDVMDVVIHDNVSKQIEHPCVLTEKHLDVDKLKVLTVIDGLFYAGRLHAVEPPDVYSITLDGERGNRPHIMSREEVLRDAIVEVSTTSMKELLTGTRVCAYWSQQYRSLYPGSIAEPQSPDPLLDNKFATVEFDDGDNGRICIDEIRLLPPGYPVMAYDPNPLMSLCKRRRRTEASVEERQLNQPAMSPTEIVHRTPNPELQIETENSEEHLHQKHKRLKKKKHEKHSEKKRKHKHKLCDENCKHKKHHKKHRKHKRRHHSKSSSFSSNEDAIEEQVNKVIPDTEPAETETSQAESIPEDDDVVDPNNEVTREDIETTTKRERQESCESRSTMTAFLPAQQLWRWHGPGYRRPGANKRCQRTFYRSIKRGNEIITVGNSAVFLSTGRADRPFIGRVESMWQSRTKVLVKVKWFYHPEETSDCQKLKYPGALFESPHVDENDIQTISHKCEVLSLKEYKEKLGNDPNCYATVYENNDVYYIAGYYDPAIKVLKVQKGIPFDKNN